jgi:hypothetical protein
MPANHEIIIVFVLNEIFDYYMWVVQGETREEVLGIKKVLRPGLNQSFKNVGGLFIGCFMSLKFVFFQAVQLLVSNIQNNLKISS